MTDLKLIIYGQILLTLTTLHPFQDRFNEGEQKDFEDLKRCAEILKLGNKE